MPAKWTLLRTLTASAFLLHYCSLPFPWWFHVAAVHLQLVSARLVFTLPSLYHCSSICKWSVRWDDGVLSPVRCEAKQIQLKVENLLLQRVLNPCHIFKPHILPLTPILNNLSQLYRKNLDECRWKYGEMNSHQKFENKYGRWQHHSDTIWGNNKSNRSDIDIHCHWFHKRTVTIGTTRWYKSS